MSAQLNTIHMVYKPHKGVAGGDLRRAIGGYNELSRGKRTITLEVPLRVSPAAMAKILQTGVILSGSPQVVGSPPRESDASQATTSGSQSVTALPTQVWRFRLADYFVNDDLPCILTLLAGIDWDGELAAGKEIQITAHWRFDEHRRALLAETIDCGDEEMALYGAFVSADREEQEQRQRAA